MIVVAIIGILASLAIYGVNRYVTNAKSAEAREMLGRMAKNAVTAFEREGMSAAVLALGASAAVNHRLCSSATVTVPSTIAKAKGAKYQSSQSEWKGGATVGWPCLNFSITGPQYFLYQYKASGPTGSFTCTAHGDLDGDATTSTFQLKGEIKTDGSKQVATFAPNFVEVNPAE